MLIEKSGITALQMKIHFILFPNNFDLGTSSWGIGKLVSNLPARPIYTDTDVQNNKAALTQIGISHHQPTDWFIW